jgi:hypothetical protein
MNKIHREIIKNFERYQDLLSNEAGREHAVGKNP